MKISKLILKDFQLFQSAEINPAQINLIRGINHDNSKDSSNGSGKSTLLKTAILFALYGEGCGKKLNKLIHFGTKEAEVKLALSHNNKNYIISRKIPSALKIIEDGKELQFNTPTIAQNHLNQLFGDYQFFRKYCLIDDKGINLLDSLEDTRSIVSFKKELMQFIDTEFAPIRESLLKKKNDREIYNVDKRLYHFYLSTKRWTILENGLKRLQEEESTILKDKREQESIINNLVGEIKGKEKEIYWKTQEKKKLNNGYCPILNNKCSSLAEQLDKVNKEKTKEIINLETDIKIIELKLKEEENYLKYYNDLYAEGQNHIKSIQQCLMKLKEAQKFSEYKYTKSDVQLYADSIKTLDSFSGYFIQEWLTNLTLIINDLLKPVNLSIELTDEKEFIKIKDGKEELTYDLLSSGQICFLSAIFKLGILLQKGESDRIIIADDGMGSMDEINFRNFIEVCRNLPMQFFIIYQDCPQLEEINYIVVERKDGKSEIK
jgi:hypothetical protein